ncbi:MAG: hypothetical protein AVDCRST_MAG39-1104 [uncultured Sphingomonadaceae bacterium]|uniref:TonB C-terminal domain-containing protein n=1 Tax=uncultured Sphingomonadaceae bacterium TaxID=169976 RepID=A0A6J4SLN8_9SPHN|nr:MAG: hypothetical protein AVDCRST_MAG39-1104 [uncultured Sphingomonadaceae bacterium]
MPAIGGFAAQRRSSPASLALVDAAHAAAVAALLLAKGPVIFDHEPVITEAINIPLKPPPPPELMVEQPKTAPSVLDLPDPIIAPPLPRPMPPVDRTDAPAPSLPLPPGPPTPDLALGPKLPPPLPVPQPEPKAPPVRVDARLDPRYAGALQPDYPSSELRAENEGNVTVRVTIGRDGRVAAVECVRAASDAFCQATREQALRRWRFKPATEDGRPVEASKTMMVRFLLENA